MSIVTFKRDWFDPQGKLWEASRSPHEITDEELLEQLPSDAVVDGVDPKKPKASKKDKSETAESQKQALEEKEREEKVVAKAESEHQDKTHAAVNVKTAAPPKL